MKALNLSVAFLGIILSTLGMSITIVSVTLYVTEAERVLIFNQSWWMLSLIFIGSLTLCYKMVDLLNKNL